MPNFHTTTSWRRIGAAGITALLLSAGCSPSGEAFASEADALCARSTPAIEKMREPVTIAEISELGTVLGKQTDRLHRDLAALNKPGGEEGEGVSAFLKNMKAAGIQARTLSTSALDNDLPAIEKAVADTKTAYQKTDDSARAQGLKQCSKAENAAAAKVASSSPGILKNAYVAESDVLCKAANVQFAATPEVPDSQAGLIQLFDQITTINGQLLAGLKAIAPPVAEKQAIDDLFNDLDALDRKYGEVRDAAKAGQRSRLDGLIEEMVILEQSQLTKSDRFGFRDCGSDA